MISHIDITERKQMESALAERDAKFRGIYESNMVPVAFWDLDGRITNANDAYLALTGFSRAELDEGKLSCGELTPADQLHLDKQAIQEERSQGVFVLPMRSTTCGGTATGTCAYWRRDASRHP